MKTTQISLIPVILLCLLKIVYSSNPDSVIVQDDTEDNNKSVPIPIKDSGSTTAPKSSTTRRYKSTSARIEDPGSVIAADSSKENRRYKAVPIIEDPDSVIVLDSPKVSSRDRSAPLRVEDGQLGPLTGDDKPRRLPVVRIIRPYVIGSRTVWREVGLQSFDEKGDRDPLYSVWRDFQNNRRILPGQSAFRGRPYSGSVPQKPQNNDERKNSEVQAFGGVAPYNLPSVDEPVKPLPGADRRAFGYRNSVAQSLPPPQSNFNPQNRRQQGYNPNNPRFGANAANFWERRVPPPPQTPAYQRPSPNPENTSNRRASQDANLFASIVNDFAFKVVGSLNPQTNFVISPLSIFTALAMCYLGSDGRTKAQLEQVLGMNENAVHGQHLHQGITDLVSLLMSESSSQELFMANGMFLGKNFTANAQFEEDIRKYYSAELINLDFENPVASLATINSWIARNTRNMIPNILNVPPPLQDGTYKEVPTMTLLGESFPFYRSDEHRHSFIKLPYDGDQMSMIIALPYGESDAPMPSVTDKILCNLREAMVNTQFDVVAIPKFREDYTTSLRATLMGLGITDIFNRNAVDLRKMREKNDVYVSAIFHKAVIDVNEEGTTAAAATAVRFVPLTIRNTTNFIASHPFAFYIVHERSGLVLFSGKILDLNGKPLDTRREIAYARPNPEDTRGENVRPVLNPEGNRGSNANVGPILNPYEDNRENLNGRPSPENTRRENENVRPILNPEDNRGENLNGRPRPNPENGRRENTNVRLRPNPEGFRGSTSDRNPSRIRIHGAVNFENTD